MRRSDVYMVQVHQFHPSVAYGDAVGNSIQEIKKILVEEHDFNLERVEKTVDELIRITKEKGNQSKLEQWF